ncbi:MAG: hypothetical protein ACRDQZ_25545 [Mycobacteriales bacterium]
MTIVVREYPRLHSALNHLLSKETNYDPDPYAGRSHPTNRGKAPDVPPLARRLLNFLAST